MHSTVSTAGATDTRMICLRRDLSSSPGQLLAQNRLQLRGETGLLRDLSSLNLKTSKDGGYPTSLGSLLHDLTVLINVQRKPFLILLILVVPHPPIMHHWEGFGSVFFSNSPKHTGKLLLCLLFNRLKKLLVP